MPKVPKKVEKAIKEFINRNKKILPNQIKEIILYGSYARGDDITWIKKKNKTLHSFVKRKVVFLFYTKVACKKNTKKKKQIFAKNYCNLL